VNTICYDLEGPLKGRNDEMAPALCRLAKCICPVSRLCVLVWTENILKTELLENDDITIVMWFPCSSFPQPQIQNQKWPVTVAFLNSSGVVLTENIWCVFRVKPPFANFSRVVLRGRGLKMTVWKIKANSTVTLENLTEKNLQGSEIVMCLGI